MSPLNTSRTIPKFRAGFILEAQLLTMRKFAVTVGAIAFLNPLLYLVSIGLGVGALVSKNVGPNGIDGVSYLTFIAPALLASSAIQSAIDEVLFPTIAGFKWDKGFYGMNATPQRGADIATGVFLSAMVRTAIGVSFYSLFLYLFGAMDSPHSYLAIPIAIFAGASFAALMMAIAAHVMNEDRLFVIVGRFIIAPLFLFSGTFYPLNTLPIGLQFIGWISPLWHATELGRYATYGHRISAQMAAIHFMVLLTMIVVGLVLASRQFAKRLEN